MSTRFVWLALEDDFNAAVGLPLASSVTSQPSRLWPLVAVEFDDNSNAASYHPAVAFHRDNAAMKSFLELLGFTLNLSLPAGQPWGIASLPQASATDAVALAGLAGAFSLLSADVLFAISPPDLIVPNATSSQNLGFFVADAGFATAVPAGDTDGANRTYALSLTLTGFRPANNSHSINPGNLAILIEWQAAQLVIKVAGGEAVIQSEGVVYVPATADADVLLNDQGDVVIEVSAAGQEVTGVVLIEPRVAPRLTLSDMRLRMHRGGLAFVRGSAASPELFSADFSLPLIEPQSRSLFSQGVPTILPTRSDDAADLRVKTGISLGVRFTHPDLGGTSPGNGADLDQPLFEILRAPAAGNGELSRDLHLDTSRLGSLLGGLQTVGVAGEGLKLTSLAGSLGSLLSSGTGEAKFALKSAQNVLAGASDLVDQAKDLLESASNFPVPLALEINLGDEVGTIHLFLVLRFNLWQASLADSRVYFYCQLKADGATGSDRQWIDLKTFAFALPSAGQLPQQETNGGDGNGRIKYPTPEDHDGYLDFDQRELTIDYRRANGQAPASELAFPGQFATASAPTPDELNGRFRLQLESFDPEDWQNPAPAEPIRLRLRSRGLSVSARAFPGARTTELAGKTGGDSFGMQVVDRGEGAGRLVVVDSRVVFGKLSATMELPGLDLQADVDVSARQDSPEQPPRITARVSLRGEGPLAEIAKLELFRLRVQSLAAEVTWNGGNRRWEITAFVSGDVALREDASAPGGLDSLKLPRAIRFNDVNLLELHKGAGSIELVPNQADSGDSQVIGFTLLDGRFAVSASDLQIRWDQDTKSVGLSVRRAEFQFTEPGQFDVAIQAGGIGIDLDLDDKSVELRMPSSLGIDVRIGSNFHFRGQVGWYRDRIERFFAARGTVNIQGLPEVTASLKLGVGTKRDGSRAPNVVIFGEFTRDFELFSGAVLKRIGAGIAVNNRPLGFSAKPDPDEILRQLPTLDVADPFSWRFVQEPGTFVMILMRTLIGANRGAPETVSAYLLELLVSFDSDLNAIAAGKLWLFSSPQFVDRSDNRERPVAVAAAVLRLKRQTFSLVAETRKNPAFEQGGQLSKLFDRLSIRLSSFVSPELADFYLERIAYTDNFLGVEVEVEGQYRLAVGRFGALTRASLVFRGSYRNQFELALAGFSIDGTLRIGGEFAGLITQGGVASYAILSAEIDFQVRAYLILPGIAWESRQIRIVIPAVTITVRVPKRSGWRIKWKKKTITLVERQEFELTIHVPIPVLEKKFSPPLTLNVSIHGGAAFEESGRIGFAGSVSVTVNVLGRRRKLTASLRHQEGIVDTVRRRVAAIENRLDRIRGLTPPKQLAIAAENGAVAQAPEVWYYVKRVHGDDAYHLWIPAPGSSWLAPNHGVLRQYASQPREWPELGEPAGADEIASGDEMLNASPLRDAVTRLLIETPEQVVELVMPWDRYNLDAMVPGLSAAEAVSIARHVARAETLLLQTAAPSDGDTSLGDEIRRRERSPRLVSDPRWESDSAIFLRPEAALLPPHVASADFRTAEELLARRGTLATGDESDQLARLAIYARLRKQLIRGELHDVDDPDEPDRLREARAEVTQLAIEEVDSPDTPETFGEIANLQLELGPNELDPTNPNVISVPRRRRMPVLVKAGTQFRLTTPILQNATDLMEILPAVKAEGESVTINIQVKVGSGAAGTIVTTQLVVPTGDQDLDEANPGFDETAPTIDAPAIPGEAASQEFQILLTLQDVILSALPAGLNPIVIACRSLPEALSRNNVVRKAGLVLKTTSDQTFDPANAKLRVFRRGAGQEETEDGSDGARLEVRSISDLIRVALQERMFPLKTHQRFLPAEGLQITDGVRDGGQEDTTTDTGVLGIVQLVLPVRLHEAFVEEVQPSISHFAVYRSIADGDPDLIADRVDLVLHEVRDGNREALLFNGVLLTDNIAVKRAGGGLQFFATTRDEQGGFRLGRRLRIIPDQTLVRYAVKPILYGDEPPASFTSDGQPPLFWEAVKPYVPPQDLQLPSLTLLARAEDLVRNPAATAHKIVFRLVSTAALVDAEADPGLPDGLIPEIWFEEQSRGSDGFYGDESSSESDGAEPIQRASDLGSGVTPPSDTTTDKMRLTFTRADSVFHLDASPLVSGKTYRLFARYVPQQEVADEPLSSPRMLAPLPVHLFRELPAEIAPGLAGRPVGNLEIIDREDWDRGLQSVDRAEDFLTKDQFQARRRDLQTAGGKVVRGIAFASGIVGRQSGADGGFEVIVQDELESLFVHRLVSEVVSDETFGQGISQLRDPSRWTIPDRLPVATDGPSLPTDPQQLTADGLVPLYLHVDESNPLLRDFIRARQAITEALKKLSSDLVMNWVELHNRLTDWYEAVERHRQSPLFTTTSQLELLNERMEFLGQYTILGLVPPAATGDLPASTAALRDRLKNELAEVMAQLRRAEEFRRSDTAETVREDQPGFERIGRLLRLEEAGRRVVGILRRRLALAEELFDPAEDGLQAVPLAFEQRSAGNGNAGWEGEFLPRQAMLLQACTDAARDFVPSDDPKPQIQESFEKLFNLLAFNPSTSQFDAERADRASASRLLDDVSLYSQTLGLDGDVAAALRGIPGIQLARTVPQAAGLTAAVNALKLDLEARGMQFLRRPHHQVQPADPSRPEGTGLKLSDLMPDLFVHDPQVVFGETLEGGPVENNPQLSAPTLRSGVVALLNVFERLGLAVDVAAADELRQLVPPEDLVGLIAAQPWSDVLQPLTDRHVPLLVTVREPDGDAIDDPSGLWLGKLVVLPEPLLSLLKEDEDADQVQVRAREVTVLTETDTNFTIRDADPNASPVALKLEDLLAKELFIQGQAQVSFFAADVEISQSLLPKDAAQFTKGTEGPAEGDKLAVVFHFSRTALLKQWLELRGISLRAGSEAEEAKLLIDLFSQLRKAVRSLDKSDPATLRQLQLEEREGLIKTRPVRANLARGFWPLEQPTGHNFQVAVRRISRYEHLARWAAGLPIHRPRLPLAREILDAPQRRFTHKVEFLPLDPPLSDFPFDPKTLPAAPHPTRPGFVFQLPPSAARSMLSAISKTRTGFEGLDFAFLHQFADADVFPAEGSSGGVIAPRWVVPVLAAQVEWNPPANPSSMQLSGIESSRMEMLKDPRYDLLVVVQRPGTPLLCISKDVDEDAGVFNVDLREQVPSGLNVDVELLVVAKQNIPALFHLLHNVLAPSNVNKTPQAFTVESSSLPIPMEAAALEGKIVRVKAASGDEFARFVRSYDPRTGRIALHEALPNSAYTSVSVLLAETPVQTVPLFSGAVQDPMLLRYEQLFTLERVPYHHEYAAGNVARYALDGGDSESRSALTPQSWIARRPERLGVRPPVVRKGNGTEFHVRLLLSRYEDHLTAAERDAVRHMPGFDLDSVTVGGLGEVHDWHLPDPHVTYSLLWRIAEDSDASTPHLRVAELVLKRDSLSETTWQADLTYVNRTGDERNVPIRLAGWRPQPGSAPVYEIELTLDSAASKDDLPGLGGRPPEQKQLVLQCTRGGFDSPIINPEIEES
jgi:hypothetical protein